MPLDPIAFPIEDKTWAERYIFAEASKKKILTRLVIVQFEHALDGSSFRFLFPPKPPMQWGNETYRRNAFTDDLRANIVANPGKEADSN